MVSGSDQDPDDIGAGLTFFLSGKVQTNLHGLTGEIEEIVGHHYLCSHAGVPETELWKAGEPFLRVYVLIDPVQLFGNLTGKAFAQLPVQM